MCANKKSTEFQTNCFSLSTRSSILSRSLDQDKDVLAFWGDIHIRNHAKSDETVLNTDKLAEDCCDGARSTGQHWLMQEE